MSDPNGFYNPTPQPQLPDPDWMLLLIIVLLIGGTVFVAMTHGFLWGFGYWIVGVIAANSYVKGKYGRG